MDNLVGCSKYLQQR